MLRISFLIIFAICCECAIASLDSTKILRTIYVSSSTGDNNNAGDESHPLKDISAITGELKTNSRILLRRGDVFFDKIVGVKNCIIDAYGVGENPVICGFKILKETSSWEKIESNIWRLDLSDNDMFLGFKDDKYSNATAGGNIGFIYVPTNDLIIGNMLSSQSDLKRDGDFFISNTNKKDSINKQSFKYLILRRKKSPTELGNICLSTGEHGIQNIYNTICRNLSVVGFGKHGCVTVQGCTIENCKFDLIGGSLLIGYHKWSRYGNGIEISASGKPCCHNMVKHCQFSRIYDCAMTIQGSGADMQSNEDNHFRDNVVYHCRQAFERYLLSTNTQPIYLNCDFSNNICFGSGNNQFGITHSFNDAHLLSYEDRDIPFIIKDNIFYDGNLLCAKIYSEGMIGNEIYLYSDQYLSHSYGKTDYPTLIPDNEKSIQLYRNRTKDNSNIKVLKRGSIRNYFLKKQILREMNYQAPAIDYQRLTSCLRLQNEQ